MSQDALTPHTQRRVAWQTEHDAPTRAALSKRARGEIAARFDDIAARHGYHRQDAGEAWVRTSALMRQSFSLQPSRYGFECFVNLAAKPRSALSTVLGIAVQNQMRLGWFYDGAEPGQGEVGAICYPDVLEQGAAFQRACQVLDIRALPFLNSLNGRKKADMAAYRAHCPPLPSEP